MPKRTDIKKIMLIGSGPIAIGQGCEFDYSGVQACKVLKQEGFEVVLVNSNPATIMTDVEFADRTYLEPLTLDSLHEIIRRERPDALLPTLGGQTALNLAIELSEKNILDNYHVELIGANATAIKKAEDRQLFKEAMKEINLTLPMSGSAHTMEEALTIADTIGKWPLIIRPGFTLGGTGGGIAYDLDELKTIVARGLKASSNSEVLIEESLLGWKEYELEVIRDRKNNAVIVCSIENLDPMGVHTGDSITIAPAQTLTDKEYQIMRDNSLKVMEVIGVETGGSNVQWAVNPEDGRQIVIEMNPRVSRSSALASKATGFPIAKIATLLAVGYTLDEIQNDITKVTPSCFEPALDYVVTKIPRFTFEKFPAADSTLGTQMKSVGESMAIGRSFKQSFQKALRSLDTGFWGFGCDVKSMKYQSLSNDELLAEIKRPHAERIICVYEGLRRGFGVELIFETSKIDRYYLRHLSQLVEFEKDIKLDVETIKQAKFFGYADRQIAHALKMTELEIRQYRKDNNINPNFGLVDTCAGEFEASTPYYYSSYSEYSDEVKLDGEKKQSVMILGGGPNRIGQGIEFDYCCVHAAFALKEAGYETIMVNCNPETVSTDYDTSDKLYFEALTFEDIMNIYEREKCLGVIVQFGGQTPLNLATQLKEAGVNILGTSPESIDAAEDRDYFKKMAEKLNIKQPPNGIAHTVDEAVEIARAIGYPVLVRPSFVLGGRAMVIVYKDKYLRQYVEEAVQISDGKPILIDRFLEDATEVDVDFISDGKVSVMGGIMEHVELAGIHSGDSACSIPPQSLSDNVIAIIKKQSAQLAKELNVCGLINIQFAVQGEDVYILEVNPRASRTVPFVSKAIGVPLAKKAALCMVGKSLEELNFTKEVDIPYTAFKEAVFPFVKFPGVDIVLSPEMKSTGEVMGLDFHCGTAYLKAQMAANNEIPHAGSIFISLRDADKDVALPHIKELSKMGFQLFCTRGTATMLYDNNIKCRAVYRISEGRPNLLDLLAEKKVNWIINTPEAGAKAMVDEIQMRSSAVLSGVPISTTVAGFEAAIAGLKNHDLNGRISVCSLQEYHRHLDNE